MKIEWKDYVFRACVLFALVILIACFGEWDAITHLSPEGWTAAFTGVLAVFTALLVAVSVFQGAMLIRSDQTARRSADAATASAEAATLSARAALRMELPRLEARIQTATSSPARRILDLGDGELDEHFESTVSVETINITNLGRTPATLTRVDVGCAGGVALSTAPDYQTATELPRIIVSVNQERPLPLPTMTVGLMSNKTTDDASYLWFYISLYYVDFMDDQHEIRFCWRRGARPDRGGNFGLDNTAPTAYRTRP